MFQNGAVLHNLTFIFGTKISNDPHADSTNQELLGTKQLFRFKQNYFY